MKKFIFLMIISTSVNAEIYKCKINRNVQYQDVPCGTSQTQEVILEEKINPTVQQEAIDDVMGRIGRQQIKEFYRKKEAQERAEINRKNQIANSINRQAYEQHRQTMEMERQSRAIEDHNRALWYMNNNLFNRVK